MLIIGPQGAGKGTQAQLLSQHMGVAHISTGDLFRSNVAGATELGVLADSFMQRGELVPDEVTRAMVADRLSSSDTSNGFLLDGFPRTVGQAEWLTDLLAKQGKRIDAVIVLSAPDQQLVERLLLRGRKDDTPDVIQRRLQIYREETEPLLQYYSAVLVPVDGDGEIDDVQRQLRAAVAASGQSINVAPNAAPAYRR